MKITSTHIKQRAFTLIELLTVIAIIGILTAIIISVVSKVRESARSAQCISNLRQIYAGMVLYAGDHKDRLPGRTGTNQGPIYPFDTSPGYVYTGGFLSGYLRDYLSPPRVILGRGNNRWISDTFVCPSWAAKGGLDRPNSTTAQCESYLRNGRPWPDSIPGGNNQIRPLGDYNDGIDPLSLASLSSYPLSRTWMITDADNQFISEVMSGIQGFSARTSYLDNPAHGSTRNVLYYDGHVTKLTNAQFRPFP